jgi:hypothetical protein
MCVQWQLLHGTLLDEVDLPQLRVFAFWIG